MTDSANFQYTGTANLEVMAEAVRYNAFLLDLVRRQAEGRPRVIDFGAGIGTFARALGAEGLAVECVEPDEAQRAHILATGLAAHASIADLGDASVDLLYSLNVLEHIEQDEEVLAAIRHKLRPAGRVLIYVPAFELLFSDMDRLVGHVRRYRRPDLVAKIERCGFRIERAEYVDCVGFLAALVYRMTDRSGGRIDRRALATYDRWVFPVSRWLDRAGVGRLFGKNLLVVATAF